MQVTALLDAVLHDYEDKEQVVERALHADKRLREFFGAFRASRVETATLHSYVKHRRTAGVSNATINRKLALLRRAFNLAKKSTPPQVNRVPVFPILKEAPPRRGFFEHDEFLAQRKELPEHLKPVLTFAYNTGCRKGEILALGWEQVDLFANVVRLNPGETKNDDGRVIALAGELLSMLIMQRQIRDQLWPDCPWVFFRYGRRIKSFRGAWEEASKRAGLWDAERDRPRYIFHDLRRTGARNLVRAGVPEAVVMSIGGWRTRSIFDRYNIVSERDLHDAAAKLEEYIGKVESARDKDKTRITRINDDLLLS